MKVFLAGIALLAGTAWFVTAAYADDDSGYSERGRQLYFEHGCYGCHGYDGQTGARDLVGTDSPVIVNVEAFVAFLRMRGDIVPVFPSTAMPRYPESALGDTAARDLYAYIRSFELDAPDAVDVPVLEAIIESASED